MKIHGFWSVSRVGNVLVKTSAGDFNEQGVRASLKELEALFPKDGAWAALFDSSSWNMTASTNLEIIADFEAYMVEQGCQRIACVVQSGLRQHIHRIFAGKLQPEQLQYFPDLKEACVWLSSQGFEISPDTYPHHNFLQTHRAD